MHTAQQAMHEGNLVKYYEQIMKQDSINKTLPVLKRKRTELEASHSAISVKIYKNNADINKLEKGA